MRVRLNDGARVRQPAQMSELPPELLRLVRALVQARLLTTRGANEHDQVAEGSDAVVEASHEALFKAWPLLDQWLTDEREFLTDIERIKIAQDIWAQAPEDQKSKALLGGLLLSRARDGSADIRSGSAAAIPRRSVHSSPPVRRRKMPNAPEPKPSRPRSAAWNGAYSKAR